MNTTLLMEDISCDSLQFPVHLGQFFLGQRIYAVNRQSVGCYFSVCEDSLFATDGGGGLRHMILDNCPLHHAWSNSPSQSLPS